ncbi:oligosaccharide flippase family protein [Algoriphagus sp. D3-2-R+10]|uniref:lipopolysaccharide biosynthesis protein n=1 Tax=Algoriphagus aurantiacus TaxID=3103948 RepID=UPI002B3BF034|nr:oligosaccharide flippase family protein [Algoriphagus sp. D3-2-R+10]MEB2777659.1 oligosaccharide flippase family protein [Algoriphagus sp. D3-2-R+10]
MVIKNIINSIGIKGVGILISLILIPLSINYVGAVNYGIWLTISSVVGWMNQFDFGMGNGLRNKITAEYAQKRYVDGKIYVSTTYAVLALIAAVFFVFFLIVHTFVDWTEFFNTPLELTSTVNLIVVIVLVCFCAQFVLQIISVLLTAVHLAYKSNIIQTIALVISLMGVLFLTYFTEESLIYLVLVLAFSPVVSLAIYTIYYFTHDLSVFKPDLKRIDFKKSKGLFSVGWLFFIVQLGSLMLYQTSNIIIAKVLGLEEVSVFNVVYKYFTALFMIITVILNPYWSAFADAYELKDYVWMEKSLKNLRRIFLLFFVLNVICVVVSPFVFNLWLGDSLLVPFSVTWTLGIYFIAYFWYNIHVTFIYGVGKLYLQVVSIVLAASINVPLSIYLGGIYGLPGVIYSNIIVFTFLGLITYIQVQKIVNKKAIGFWDK